MTHTSNNNKITIGTKIRLKASPDEILCIISNDCHFDTTPFSKYIFSKFCYEFEGVCNTLVVIGVIIVSISLFI